MRSIRIFLCLKMKERAITQWHKEDRPREKLLRLGAEQLSTAELLAILIGSGSPQQNAVQLATSLLEQVDHKLILLAGHTTPQMCKLKGIGESKAVRITASLELAKRFKTEEHGKVTLIGSSKDAFQLFGPRLETKIYEEFWILMLNRRNQVIKPYRISEGGVSGTLADPKKIFKTALEHNASGIILCHNHPSGNLKPSNADMRLTQRIKKGAAQLDIQLLDHLIIANRGYFSFADEGVL